MKCTKFCTRLAYLYVMLQIKRIHELTGHTGPVYALALGRTKQEVLSCSSDHFIAEWMVDSGGPSAFSIRLQEPCFTLCYIEELELLLAGTASGSLHVIDLTSKQELRNLKVHSKGIFAILYTHDLVIVAGGDGFISVYHPATWKLLRHFSVGEQKVRSLSVSGDDLLVTTSGGDVIGFDLPWLNEHFRFHAHEGGCYCAEWHPSKPLLVTGGKDGHLRFWHRHEQHRAVHAIAAHNFGIYRVKFSPNGLWAATASRDKTIKLWDASLFNPMGRMERPSQPAHTHSVNDLLWFDQHTLITCGDDRRILVWQVTA